MAHIYKQGLVPANPPPRGSNRRRSPSRRGRGRSRPAADRVEREVPRNVVNASGIHALNWHELDPAILEFIQSVADIDPSVWEEDPNRTNYWPHAMAAKPRWVRERLMDTQWRRKDNPKAFLFARVKELFNDWCYTPDSKINMDQRWLCRMQNCWGSTSRDGGSFGTWDVCRRCGATRFPQTH